MPVTKKYALTDAQLRKLLAAAAPTAVADGDGLTFTLSDKGTAAWVLRYRHGQRRRELTLGRYPDLSLAEARRLAARERVRVQQGEDVATTRQREKALAAQARTVRELYREFEQRVMPTLAGTTVKSLRGYWEKGVVAKIGAMPAAAVTIEDAFALIDRAATRSYWAADNTRKAGQMLFRYAEDRRMIVFNPFTQVRMRTVRPKPPKRERIALSNEQLRQFLTALHDLGEVDALLAQVLLYTGARIGEALSAAWVDLHFELDEWRMPRAKIKTRKYMANSYHAVTLTPTLRAVFLRLHELADGSPWVFPTISPRKEPTMDHEAALARFAAYAASLHRDFPSVVFHDLRSTVRTGLRRLGIDATVRKRAINHKVPGIDGIYDQVAWEEIAEAQRHWQLHLDHVRNAPPAETSGAKVIPLRRRAA